MTPGFIRTAACSVIAALALALAPGAFAANEVGDAGDLRVTANDMGDSAVTQIDGAFTDAMDADVYRICLTDGASFSASTRRGRARWWSERTRRSSFKASPAARARSTPSR